MDGDGFADLKADLSEEDMAEFIPFHVPDTDEMEIRRVADVIRSGWMTTGPRTQEFERSFAAYVGARHAVAVNSGTAALHLALACLGIPEGADVLLPTMTFAATAEVVFYLRARPVLVDCASTGLNLDPEDLVRKWTPSTRVVIPVHVGGDPCDLERILAVAAEREAAVIEDAAHALPAKLLVRRPGEMNCAWRSIGAIGDITCFSFYATKTLTTGEGGMLVTDSEEWAERARRLSLHGLSRGAWRRYDNRNSWEYEIIEPGFKYNLTDIASAIGLAQLEKCDRMWAARAAHATRYTQAFTEVPEISLPSRSPEAQHAWHLFVIALNLERLTITRAEFVHQLKECGIGASVHFIPLHLHPYYKQTFGYSPSDFPHATAFARRIVSLPLYSKMTEADVERVIEAVYSIISRNRR